MKKKAPLIPVGPPKKKRKFSQITKSTQTQDHLMLVKLRQRGLMKRELKFIDTNLSNTTLFPGGSAFSSGSWVFTLLNGVSEGTDEQSRIGRELTLTSIYMRGSVNGTITPTEAGFCKWYIVQDTQSNAAIFPITNFLISDDINALGNLDYRTRFKIIATDKWEQSGNLGNDKFIHLIDFYKKLNIPVEFNNNNAGTIADITRNSLYLLTNTYGLGVNSQNTVLNIRVRFDDN